jgi:ribose transport system permease protein
VSSAPDTSKVVPTPASVSPEGDDAPDTGLRRHHLKPSVLLDRFGLITLLGVTVLIFSLLKPSTYATTANFQTILSSQSVLMIITLGLLVPLAVGEFDLSIGAVVAFVATLFAIFTLHRHWSVGVAVTLCLLVAILIGLVNAFIVLVLNVHSFITTLGTGTVIGGLTTLVGNSQVFINLPQSLQAFAQTTVLGLPLPVFYGLGIAALLWYVFEMTPTGRRLFFVGRGRDAARLAGISVIRYRAVSFVVSSLAAGFAGLVVAGQLGSADPTVGPSYLLPAYAGAFLGATTFKPGRMNAWGTVVALYLLTAGIAGLEQLGASGWITDVFYGGALIIGVASSELARRRHERARSPRRKVTHGR